MYFRWQYLIKYFHRILLLIALLILCILVSWPCFIISFRFCVKVHHAFSFGLPTRPKSWYGDFLIVMNAGPILGSFLGSFFSLVGFSSSTFCQGAFLPFLLLCNFCCFLCLSGSCLASGSSACPSLSPLFPFSFLLSHSYLSSLPGSPNYPHPVYLLFVQLFY